MSGPHARLARGAVRLAAALLPPGQQRWGEAMMREVEALDDGRAALGFALGCLGGAVRQALVFLISPSPHIAAPGDSNMNLVQRLLHDPRQTGALCAIAATGLGLAYLAAASAPLRYLAVNTVALASGLALLAIAGEAGRRMRIPSGLLTLLMGVGLLATALFGVSVQGATRWIGGAGFHLQPSLIFVPVMAVLFVKSSDRLAMAGIVVAAVGLTLQPDRAMAGALAAGLGAAAVLRPRPGVLFAFAMALAAFLPTLLRANLQEMAPFVEGVMFSSFDIHPLAGAAVVAGLAVMFIPVFVGLRGGSDKRAAHAAFGAAWLAVVAAAVWGPHPTPLLGYGASAILGYLISLAALAPASTAPLQPVHA